MISDKEFEATRRLLQDQAWDRLESEVRQDLGEDDDKPERDDSGGKQFRRELFDQTMRRMGGVDDDRQPDMTTIMDEIGDGFSVIDM